MPAAGESGANAAGGDDRLGGITIDMLGPWGKGWGNG
jgi:hypothetical protein